MRAVLFDGALRYEPDHPTPSAPPGWALIQVRTAGICKTDMELTKGYMGFKGILGHEFIGTVAQCDDPQWIGKSVVGEINAACGSCEWCARGLGRHCPHRCTLGIDRLDGCMADYCILPVANLLEIPSELSENRAILTEPLSAACEILEQLPLSGTERAVVLGDGRLGILCAWVLATMLSDVAIIGHHPEKLALAAWRHIQQASSPDEIAGNVDIIVEATGSGQGIVEAMALCRPRGTIVLKSTVALQGDVNLAPIVINELTVLGSRCGQFKDGLQVLADYPDMPVERLITARYPIEEVERAFTRATERDALKVLLDLT